MKQAPLAAESESVAPAGATRLLWPPPEPQEVQSQLERILASPRFTSSPRCQLMLRYLVERSLDGNSASLKERTIGIEILKRDPDYDTNADPAVRMAASEIRKKLAQYYYDRGHQEPVRIELPTGSYAPVFSRAEWAAEAPVAPASREATSEAAPGVQAAHAPPVAQAQSALPRGRIVTFAAVAVFVLAVCASILVQRADMAPTPMQEFWAPVLKSSNPLLIYPDQMRATAVTISPVSTRTPTGSFEPRQPPKTGPEGISVMVVQDAVTMANVVGTLHAEHKQFFIRGVSSTSYADLQKGADVLFGGFNNDWTIYLTRSMRFRFMNNADGDAWIQDEKNAEAKIGLGKFGDGAAPEQLGLVARVFVRETNQPALILAGIGPAGTVAAGDFVTNSQYLDEFLKTAPKDWQKKNMEIVVGANVIGGQPGPPHVVASAVW